jgi:hypothetical protein
MHRAALPAIGILAPLVWVAGVAAAEPWSVRMETGAEADTNVARVETALDTPPRIAAGAGRLGARIIYRGALLGGGYAVDVSGLARMIASSNDELDDENVVLGTAELHWLRPIGERPITVGVHATAADSFAMLGGVGARTFRNLGGDAMVVLGRGDGHRLTLGVGGRDFVYKPVPMNGEPHMFDWRGPVASAQLNAMLWQTSDHTENLELAASFGFEQRSYASKAIANCSPPIDVEDPCSEPTALRRRDRYQRAGLSLTWTGVVIATGSYQAMVVDSNSFGQSLTRQRITAQVTTELFGKLLATGAATLQIDQYPDGVPIQKSVEHQVFTNLEDENRSSLQILLSLPLSGAWSVEARGALWRDFASIAAATFRRSLLYAGVVYAH